MRKTFIIAEIGNNHEGSFHQAKRLILAAKKCGVNAVKFQTYIPELFVSLENKKRYEKLKKFQLSHNQFKLLARYCKKIGIIFFSTPLDEFSADYLNKFQKIFKVSSADNDYFSLIKKLANYNKTLIVSTGFSDLSLINKVKKLVFNSWKKLKKNNKKLILMHCVSSYPVKNEEANLKAIRVLKKKFKDCVIGYSDHTVGITASIAAVSLGAQFIEKHFTIDKNYSNFRDHKLSADTQEMTELVSKIDQIEKLMGTGKKIIQKSEKIELGFVRRKAVAKKRILKGEKFNKNNIKWVRAKNGFKNFYEKKLFSKVCKTNIPKDKVILKRYLK